LWNTSAEDKEKIIRIMINAGWKSRNLNEENKNKTKEIKRK